MNLQRGALQNLPEYLPVRSTVLREKPSHRSVDLLIAETQPAELVPLVVTGVCATGGAAKRVNTTDDSDYSSKRSQLNVTQSRCPSVDAPDNFCSLKTYFQLKLSSESNLHCFDIAHLFLFACGVERCCEERCKTEPVSLSLPLSFSLAREKPAHVLLIAS